jgi:hypothetical protein
MSFLMKLYIFPYIDKNAFCFILCYICCKEKFNFVCAAFDFKLKISLYKGINSASTGSIMKRISRTNILELSLYLVVFF